MVKKCKNVFIFMFSMFLITSCSKNNLKKIEGIWEFKFDEISEYQIVFEEGSFIFIENEYFTDKTVQFITQGSYEINEKKIILSGNQGDIAVDGQKAATPELMEMWDGTYSYKITKQDNLLTLTKDKGSVSFTRKGFPISEEDNDNNIDKTISDTEQSSEEVDDFQKKIDHYELYVLLKDETEFTRYVALSFEETENALMIVLENQEYIEIPADTINIVMKNEVYAKSN